MSEVIVAKAGGTSNSDAPAVLQSMEWAERADIFVVSAPGKLEGTDRTSDKVTNMLLDARESFEASGYVESEVTEAITSRYASIVAGLGHISLPKGWTDSIPTRIRAAAQQSEDAASMLGEQLQAEIYQAAGFRLLDPARAPHDLGNDQLAWRSWLGTEVQEGNKYVLPGNITKVAGHLKTFSRGGSDTTSGYAAFGVNADVNWNLTDDSALSADPRLIPVDRLKRIDHLLYEEGRELGRNGTGLVHPAAMVPLKIGNIPTEIRSTFDRNATPTRLDNEREVAAQRIGQVVALSLMNNVTMLRIYEPGMAESVGRLAEFDSALASERVKVPVIDSQGDGVDGQKYFVETAKAAKAYDALAEVTSGEIEASADLSFITLVGYRLERSLLDNIHTLSHDSGLSREQWQKEGHDFSTGRHSLRISVRPEEARETLDSIHKAFIENK